MKHWRTNRYTYFAYGANTNFSAMSYRCPGAEFVGVGRLHGHRLVFRGVADIEASPAHHVAGAVWLISDEHLAALDAFEGYPKLYTRRAVPVQMDGEPVGIERDTAALVYVMQRRNQHSVRPPYPMYLETLAEGYANCGLPKDQLIAATRHAHETPEPIWTPPHHSRQWAEQEN